MNIFKGQNLIEFAEHFKSDEDCKKYLSELKWNKGYSCRKCGHSKSQIRKDFSRTCNICSTTESSSANTLFHKVKFIYRYILTKYIKSTDDRELIIKFLQT